MLILAIEQSSDLGSIALLDNENILAEGEWDAIAERGGGPFAVLKKLLAGLPAQLDDIGAYAVDVGPGSYSGLRASMAAVRAFALPDEKPIYAVTSAEVIAFEIMSEFMGNDIQKVGRGVPALSEAEGPAEPSAMSATMWPLAQKGDRERAAHPAVVAPERRYAEPRRRKGSPYHVRNLSCVQVVGDARRGQWWTCVYRSGGDIPAICSNLCLVNENELNAEPGTIIVSPDWHRIGEGLIHGNLSLKVGREPSAFAARHSAAPARRRPAPPSKDQNGGAGTHTPYLPEKKNIGPRLTYIIRERVIPKAGWLGRLAARKMHLNIRSEPLTPVYLHAAVAERHEGRSQ